MTNVFDVLRCGKLQDFLILKLGEYPHGLPWSPILKLEIAGAKQKFASNTQRLAVVGIANFRRFFYSTLG